MDNLDRLVTFEINDVYYCYTVTELLSYLDTTTDVYVTNNFRSVVAIPHIREYIYIPDIFRVILLQQHNSVDLLNPEPDDVSNDDRDINVTVYQLYPANRNDVIIFPTNSRSTFTATPELKRQIRQIFTKYDRDLQFVKVEAKISNDAELLLKLNEYSLLSPEPQSNPEDDEALPPSHPQLQRTTQASRPINIQDVLRRDSLMAEQRRQGRLDVERQRPQSPPRRLPQPDSEPEQSRQRSWWQLF